MTGVVLHIGLHKTATRFLQRAVFRSLDGERFLFNPPALERPLRRALRRRDAPTIEAARAAVATALEQAGGRTLLVSEPHIAGDMYSGYSDWAANRDLVRELFPGARILYFVRRQSDWLHSAYRQAMAKGPGVPIEFFLNYRDGAFRPRASRFVGGARNLDALELPFLDIYRGYCEAFGPEQVYLFRQEDLRSRPGDIYTRLAECLGIEALPELPARVSGNRAMSGLALHLFFPGIHFGPLGRGTAPPRETRVHRLRRRLRRWRTVFIQHVFDRLIYRDWDLLARHGMREQLENHYHAEDQALRRAAHAVLDHGPGRHALRAAGAEGADG